MDPFALMSTLSDQLWRSGSLDSLMSQFFQILKTALNVQHFAFFSAQERWGRTSMQPHRLPLDPSSSLSMLDPSLQQELERQIGARQAKYARVPSQIQHAFHTFSYQNTVYQYAQLGDFLQSKTSHVCLWSPVVNHETVLNYLLRLVQNEYSWLRKLDHTQALLYQDELTGLYNYRYLDVLLDSELRRANRYKQAFSLLFIDIDNFKAVNDSYGHLVGSAILREFGAVLKEELREVDTIIRYGGDEYIILLLGSTVKNAAVVAERLRLRIETTAFHSGASPLRLTSSIGIASYPEHGRDKKSLLQVADETMYQSKRGGKNRVMVLAASPHPPELHQ